ncbi:SMI1/KNR4 family protein [Chamaesiphon sp.]|uniref:SMI1/KNR4 family protein n=1 Tax=Chamaesiphon sp. TaxID=2814140 RepID=UPI0035930E96
MDTQSLFRELLELIGSTRPEYVEALGKGYSRKEIEDLIDIRPIPEALIAIYSCVTGLAYDNYNSYDLVPAYDLISLDRINEYIEMYREMRSDLIDEIGEEEYHEFGNWEPDMIPFLHDGCGYTVHVRTLPDDESVWVRPKVDDLHKINSSLDRFILTAIECYRQAAYYQQIDEDVPIWYTDEDLAQEIVRKIDPEIEDYSPP